MRFREIHLTGGFTLLETAVVIFISGVLFAFTLQSVDLMDQEKLNVSAYKIAEDIRLVQQLSMTGSNYTYSVLFDCVNDRYLISRDIYAYKNVSLPKGIDLVGTNFDFDNTYPGYDNKLIFNNKGEPCNRSGFLCGGHLSLQDKKGSRLYVIVTSNTGRVRVDIKPPI